LGHWAYVGHDSCLLRMSTTFGASLGCMYCIG
jgi:hypothetical protein